MCGDGRCDSPGYSNSGSILHFENFDKREVGLKSPNMECEGLKQGLKK